MTVMCRRANIEDTDALYDLIQGYAAQGIMLPRTKDMLKHLMSTFVVAEDEGKVVGCGSLCRLGQDLVEIRSLGISDGYKGQGIGGRIVALLEAEAREQHISKVMALTYEVSFFVKNGYAVVSKEIFPEKVWTDCVNCPKQDCCDEIAVLKRLDLT